MGHTLKQQSRNLRGGFDRSPADGFTTQRSSTRLKHKKTKENVISNNDISTKKKSTEHIYDKKNCSKLLINEYFLVTDSMNPKN